MARRETAARRYAEAAFEIGRADGTLEAWERDLATAARGAAPTTQLRAPGRASRHPLRREGAGAATRRRRRGRAEPLNLVAAHGPARPSGAIDAMVERFPSSCGASAGSRWPRCARHCRSRRSSATEIAERLRELTGDRDRDQRSGRRVADRRDRRPHRRPALRRKRAQPPRAVAGPADRRLGREGTQWRFDPTRSRRSSAARSRDSTRASTSAASAPSSRWATASPRSTACPARWRRSCSSSGNGIMGMAFNLEEETVGALILGDYTSLKEGDQVKTTGRIVEVPVGDALIGRVVNPLGEPLDGKGPIETTKTRPIERIAPGVIVRQPVDTPVQTGHQGHRLDDPDRPRPARADHRRPPDREDRHRDRHDHQPEGPGPHLHLRRHRPEAVDRGAGGGAARGVGRHGAHHRRLRRRQRSRPRCSTWPRTPA